MPVVSLREHALHLASKGFSVFPIEPLGTRPGNAFSKHSTNDINKIKRYWRTDESNRNIGVHTGNGLMVLDVDKNHNGIENLIELLKEHGPLPDTFAVNTPSGGMHFYFKSDKDIRNSASAVADGVDIRGYNGFVVAPGSVRAANGVKPGGVYEAVNDLPVAQCPPWLEHAALGAVSSTASKAALPAAEPLKTMEVIPKQQRNDRLFKEACSQRAYGADKEAILAYLRARKIDNSDNSLSDDELQLIASQAVKYEPNPVSNQEVKSGKKKTKPKKESEEDNVIKPFEVLKSDDLYKMNIPPLKYCIEPLLAEGVYLLNGRPKGGKSWLSLELASAVATGELLWGEFKTIPGNVLYLALEDGHRRLRDRLACYGNPKGLDLVINGVERIGEGLTEQLTMWVEQSENPKLIVIDILQRVMGENTEKANAYKFDYNMTKELQEWATEHRITLLIVHHTRKMVTDHDMDSVSGSQGLSGAVDGVWFLKSPNNGKTGSLTMFSRDTDNGQYDLVRREKPDGRWDFIGEHAEESESPTDSRIIAQLQVDGELTAPQMAKELNSARTHIQTVMKRMFDEGRLDRSKQGSLYLYKIK